MGMRVMCRIFRSNSDNSAQPLYYTASIGLSQIIVNMMPQIVNVDATGRLCGTALQAASVSSYEKVIQIVLEAGADVKLKENIMVTYVVLVCMI